MMQCSKYSIWGKGLNLHTHRPTYESVKLMTPAIEDPEGIWFLVSVCVCVQQTLTLVITF